jgi:hypothetical protein
MKRDERTWARKFFKQFHPSAEAGAFEDWLDYVTEIDVEMHPGGRAILTHPKMNVRVELRWDETAVTSFLVEAQPGESLPPVEVSMSPYVAALELKRRSSMLIHTTVVFEPTIELKVIPASPAAGKPPSLAHYRQVQAEYDALVSAGERSPVNEIARRYKVRPGTVKSWLHRGRKYRKEKP